MTVPFFLCVKNINLKFVNFFNFHLGLSVRTQHDGKLRIYILSFICKILIILWSITKSLVDLYVVPLYLVSLSEKKIITNTDVWNMGEVEALETFLLQKLRKKKNFVCVGIVCPRVDYTEDVWRIQLTFWLESLGTNTFNLDLSFDWVVL